MIKKAMKNKLFTLLIFTLFSCNFSNSKLDKIKEYGFQNDSYILKGFSKNGILDGPVSQYYLDGTLMALWMARNGETDGETIDYYPNGKIKIFQNFINGKRHGYRYSFDENGHLTYKELFLDNRIVGHEYIHDTKGRPYVYKFTGYSNKHFFYRKLIH